MKIQQRKEQKERERDIPKLSTVSVLNVRERSSASSAAQRSQKVGLKTDRHVQIQLYRLLPSQGSE